MTCPSKLSDLPYVLLAIAANRASGSLLPPSTSMKVARASLTKAIRTLIARGLAEEVATQDADSVWREEQGRRLAVVITNTGRAAVSLADGKSPKDDASVAPPMSQPESTLSVPEPEPAAVTARTGTKQALLLELLQREQGASLDELTAATGWLPHTTRAALTGLRKKGHALVTERINGLTRYRMGSAR